MRPKHYIKNVLILLPLIFGGKLFNIFKDPKIIFAFIAFCLACSIVYIINDIKDVESDKIHEIKKNRPIASGLVTEKNAFILMIFLLIGTAVFNFLAGNSFLSWFLIIIYILINILYSLKLKNVPLLDVSILVLGFLIRLIFGSVVTGIVISNWLYLTIMGFSFYLGLGKRRNEIRKQGTNTRKVLKYYSQEFLDKNMYMCLTLTNTFYALWCIDPKINALYPNLIWTVPLVLLICMKYSMDIESDSHGDPLDTVMKDKTLIILSIIYAVIIFFSIYGSRIF